jgi:adenylate kinase
MQKFIIIGPQGSGKGTQAELLAEHYDFVHISIGDIFRWHVGHHTKLGARINRITTEGRLVTDEIVETVVRDRLEMHDWNYGFILDGFPRTRPQALYLFENWNLDRAVYLDLPDEIVRDRVMHRARVGEGSGFTKRADDNPEALKTRLREYHEKTRPLLDLFEERKMLLTIDANRTINEVYDSIVEGLSLPRSNSTLLVETPTTQDLEMV